MGPAENPSGDGDQAHAAGAPRVVPPAVLLVGLAVVPYLNALACNFAFDDVPVIEANARLHAFDLLGQLAAPFPIGQAYRPLTMLSYAANAALTHAPLGFHAVNLALHVVVSVLVFALGLRLIGRRGALVGAAVFAVHPVHSEAVTAIAGRSELLAAAFGLIAILTAGAAVHSQGTNHRRGREAASLLAFALALLSKESAATVLPLAVLYRATRREGRWRTAVWDEVRSGQWVPYAICLALFGLLWRYVVAGSDQPAVTHLDNPLAFVPAVDRIRSAIAILWDYFALLHVPLLLSADYSFNQVPVVRTWWEPRCLGGMLLLVAAAVVIVRGRDRCTTFAVAWPFIALAVTANILLPIGTVKAERLLYLPSVGWAVLVGAAIDWMWRQNRYRGALLCAGILTVAAFGARTWLRNGDWRDTPTIYANMGLTAPGSAKARFNAGVAYLQRGAPARALDEFQHALAIDPTHARAAMGTAIAHERLGHPGDAVAWYERAGALDDSLADAYASACRVLLDANDFARAVQACRAGLRRRPADAEMLKGLGASYLGLGERQRGQALLWRSLRLNPADAALRAQLANGDGAAAANSLLTGAHADGGDGR